MDNDTTETTDVTEPDTTVEPEANVSRKAVIIGSAIAGAISVVTLAVLKKARRSAEIVVIEPNTEDSDAG